MKSAPTDMNIASCWCGHGRYGAAYGGSRATDKLRRGRDIRNCTSYMFGGSSPYKLNACGTELQRYRCVLLQLGKRSNIHSLITHSLRPAPLLVSSDMRLAVLGTFAAVCLSTLALTVAPVLDRAMRIASSSDFAAPPSWQRSARVDSYEARKAARAGGMTNAERIQQ
jgi:hypothetical protein